MRVPFRGRLVAVLFGIGLVAAGLTARPTLRQADGRQPAATAPRGKGLAVPPLPEGSPDEILAFVEGLRTPPEQPRSRQEFMGYVRDVAAVSVQAADKLLAQLKPDDPRHEKAARLKLESLMMLGRLGNEQAAADMAAFAKTLLAGPSAKLAREAQRMLIVTEAQEMFEKEDLAAGPGLVEKVTKLVAADPDDGETAQLAVQLAGALEQFPGGEQLAVAAYRGLGSAFEKSGNPQIKALADGFAGTLRRLALPGNPMEISGTLLDGRPFDPKSLAGKVVLVDFWATWCGPCVAEIPNMLTQYDKYRDRGFEVVGISLDEEKEAVEGFVKEKKIPWPILYAGKGWKDPVAAHYGISGIPQLILIGRDGKVVTLNARGERLAEELAKLFKDAG